VTLCGHMSFVALCTSTRTHPQPTPRPPCAPPTQRKAGCVQYSLADPRPGWCLLSLDLATAAASAGAGASPFKALKSVQLCATLTVQGAFSSSVRFSLQVCLGAAQHGTAQPDRHAYGRR
jgi:hypothetical protein